MFTPEGWLNDPQGTALGDTLAVARTSFPRNKSRRNDILDSLRDIDGDGLCEAVMVGWPIQNGDKREQFIRIARRGFNFCDVGPLLR